MKPKKAKRIAKKIAKQLFRSYAVNVDIVRLECKDKTEKGYGGWCKAAVARQVEDVLSESNQP